MSKAITLPSELWLSIFREATILPGSLDTSYKSPFEGWRGYDDDRQIYGRKYKASLAIKAILPLVCKAWHELALPFLLENVVLDWIRLLQLARAVEENRRLCQFIRCLEVHHVYPFYGNPDSSGVIPIPQENGLRALFTIVPLLDQLHAIHIVSAYASPTPTAKSQIESLLKTCGHSLRHIDIRRCVLPDNFEYLISRYASKLEYLKLIDCSLDRPRVKNTIILPSLHTLVFDYNLCGVNLLSLVRVAIALANGEYPNLRWLMRSEAISSSPLPHAPNLRVLADTGQSDRSSIRKSIQIPYAHLEILIVTLAMVPLLTVNGSRDLLALNLRAIGIGGKGAQSCAKGVETIINFFTNPIRFPLVRHVRLFNFSERTILSTEPSYWKRWTKRMERLGIQFDDHDGTPFSVPEIR